MRGKAALGLVVLALLLRVIVPGGFMPAAGKGFAITLCTGTGAIPAWVDGQGQVHKGKSAPEQNGSDSCSFASFGTALSLPAPAGAALLPVLAASALLPARIAEVAIGRGLAAPPPPPTGPPAGL